MECDRFAINSTDICVFCGVQLSVDLSTTKTFEENSDFNSFLLEERKTLKSSYRKVEGRLTDEAFSNIAVMLGRSHDHAPLLAEAERENENSALPNDTKLSEDRIVDIDSEPSPIQLPLLTQTKPKTSAEQTSEVPESELLTLRTLCTLNGNSIEFALKDYLGYSKKEQQIRFMVLFIFAHNVFRDNSPTVEEIMKGARELKWADPNFTRYRKKDLPKYAWISDSTGYKLTSQGHKFALSILSEIATARESGKSGYVDGGSSKKSSRNKLTTEDKKLIQIAVEENMGANDYDIRQVEGPMESALFSIYLLTKELTISPAVKSSVAYSFLLEKYETLSVKRDSFMKAVRDNRNNKWFKRNENGEYFLTIEGEERAKSLVSKCQTK